jgi:hypothetical protein
MFTFDDPKAMALALVEDLPERILNTAKKGDLATIAALYNDMVFLKAAIEQLAKKEAK